MTLQYVVLTEVENERTKKTQTDLKHSLLFSVQHLSSGQQASVLVYLEFCVVFLRCQIVMYFSVFTVVSIGSTNLYHSSTNCLLLKKSVPFL